MKNVPERHVQIIKNLEIQLHPDKTRIILLENGINLLVYRYSYYHKLLRKANKIKFEGKFKEKSELYKTREITYEDLVQSLQGWVGYAMWANTYIMRKKIFENINLNKN